MLRSLQRAGTLKAQIFATRAKMKVANTMLMAAFMAAAGVMGLLAVIFLYVGVFHLLTDIAHIQPAWVYLMYFGVHVIGMGIILAVAKSKSKGML